MPDFPPKQPSQFLADPRPDGDVVELAELILDAARKGKIRTISVVVVDPLQRADHHFAGEFNPIRSNALLGGLGRAWAEVLKRF